MKNAPLFLLGLMLALVVSFGGIVLGSHGQIGHQTGYFDDADGQSYPQRRAGLASRGEMVYADLGCAACHTQQVRRPGFGSDQERGWGERQSVSRDYVHQARPQLGASRLGPDLTNLAARKPNSYSADGLYRLLFYGAGTHPAYRFLFDERKIVGERSPLALQLTDSNAPAAGFEIVPTERAQTLVAYLQSLNNAYDYPESKPIAEPKKAEAAPSHAGHGAAPADDKKQGEQKK